MLVCGAYKLRIVKSFVEYASDVQYVLNMYRATRGHVLADQFGREVAPAESLPGVEGRPFRWPGVDRIAAATLEPSS